MPGTLPLYFYILPAIDILNWIPASCLCLCFVPGIRTSAPNRVVRHELKTTAQCGASLPTAPRAYTAAARAAQRRQGSAKKRKDPGLISGQQHRPPDYIEQSRPVLKAHQEVPRPPHEDGPRATQRRRPTARSAQQMTRLPPSRAGEHTDGRTRTAFQHCDATMRTSTRRGREETAPPCLHPLACTPLPASPFTVLLIIHPLGAPSIGAPSFFLL